MVLLAGCVSENQSGTFGNSFDQEEAAQTRVSLGLTYLKNGNYSQAKQNLDKALTFAPRSASTHYGLAYYYQVVGEVERAAESYETAMQLAPEDADIANSYGAFLCQNGRYDQAKQFFLQAVNAEQYANSAQTYENMALCAQSQGKGEDAIQYLNNALKHQPGRAKTLFILTEMYVATEQFELASQTLKRYEKVARVSPDSLWMAIEIATGQGDLATAANYGDMLLSMYPDSALAKLYIERQKKLPQPVIKKKSKPQAVVTPVGSERSSASSVTPTSQAIAQPLQSSADTSLQNSATSVSAVPESPSEPQPAFHIVQPGENLYRISVKYNIKLKTLKQWNDLDENGSVKIGMKLWLAPPASQSN
ncbi:type IV pilus biogenesis/stability protein PilW [Alteromonas gilva]|uniref:type IV pilus biogenesis/stability protein PilW n=1 Tax=Alteromonas gilva TaxID=2987522 RepID=UPI002868F70D|nr:type IV pilus biogenesis/stability protein PilW [Alteromonas gilva]